MNRAFVLGLAMFFAVVGIVLLGGESTKAVAGHGCSCSCSDACKGSCTACHKCHKDRCDGCCGGLFARLRARCCAPACCAPKACCCPAPCAGSAPAAAPKADDKKPAAPPAPKTSSINRGFRTVSFVR